MSSTSDELRDVWEFWIDRGGTFTDCIGVAPDGEVHTAKVLSSDTAPVTAIRMLLERTGELAPGEALPACRVKLGTTAATNALLERRGVDTLFVATRGFGDVLVIGTQERPELFELAIEKPTPLHARTVEVAGRVAVDGEELEALDLDAARGRLEAARRDGFRSVAIALVHAYAHPEMERRLADLAREIGFEYVVASHEVAREMGLLARGETACADAYLTPLLRAHLHALSDALPGSKLRFMQSSGGLTDAARFRGPNALLSGPAGGVVGAARVAEMAGFPMVVGFDMGGTSTDVSLVRSGELERSFETLVGGVRVKAPMLRVHSVAAGGGSLCRFDGTSLSVGPESAGAEPGPLCYGNPAAMQLSLTDVNFVLGRVQPDRFPFPLEREPVERALAALEVQLREAGQSLGREAIAAGFVEIANANMAQAIAQVSVARGVDPRDGALVGFGGAAGQHVCAIARQLGMRSVLLHPFAGLLSAYGIGVSDVSWDGQRDAGRVRLPATGKVPAEVDAILAGLEAQGCDSLCDEAEAASLTIEHRLDLRYLGTETALAVARPDDGNFAAAFAAEHLTRFGYQRPERGVEIVAARVRVTAPQPEPALAPLRVPREARAPEPLRTEAVWFGEEHHPRVPVYAREDLAPGTRFEGPALILEDTGSIVVDPGFLGALDARGVVVLTDEAGLQRPPPGDLTTPDPIRLEVFGNRFMSIAEQMGAVLRNTSVSTNIKERLDYSCAVFDAAGGLVANAPHIPVHLGAMSETVREVLARFPDLREGDVVATNDPSAGGSHLPDVTAVTPVYASESEPAFFVASRGHHADLGGKSPGSMPADSTTLEEEGVLLRPFRVVVDGWFDEASLRAELSGARYPARSPDDNVAELEAMIAANRRGVELLRELVDEQGEGPVAASMRQLQEAAARMVAREIARLSDGVHRFSDALDDGTPICVTLEIQGDRMKIDFSGTGAAMPGNLNAPRAVVQAAVIYVLRTLVAERIPLNGGCLDPVEIRIPAGSLLDPPPGCAVVGGNVETSQRVVDALLGAIGRVAASQGTMNNVAFGDASFGYYETIGGGAGAMAGHRGASGVHTHMTNTRITDVEVLEARHPVRLLEFSLRTGSGGAGRHPGGDGLVRRYEFLTPVTVSLLTERRERQPYGLAGGGAGASGANFVEQSDGSLRPLAGRVTLDLAAGERLRIETPGGGGFGPPPVG